jgi:hypothetical protein
MIFIVQHDVSDEGYTDAHLLDAKKLIGIRLCFGDDLNARFPPSVRIAIDSECPPNDFFFAGPMPVISERAKLIFEKFHVNVECFPLNTTLHRGEKSTVQYYYPNFLDVIDCLDREKSSFTPEKNYATKITSVHLIEKYAKTSPAFLVALTIPCIICVQSEVGQALLESGCKGFVLLQEAEWRNTAFVN